MLTDDDLSSEESCVVAPSRMVGSRAGLLVLLIFAINLQSTQAFFETNSPRQSWLKSQEMARSLFQLPRHESNSCSHILSRLQSLLTSLDFESDEPYARCKQLFGSLKIFLPDCFETSCLSRDLLPSASWIDSCHSRMCSDDASADLSPPQHGLQKRRWGDTVLACINSLCGDSAGNDRVHCIVNRCQKRSG